MDETLTELINSRFQAVHQRQLLVISGEENWCLQQMDILLTHIQPHARTSLEILTCGVKGNLPCTHTQTDNQKFRQLLGREFDWLIYNAWQGTRASALAALSGTIKQNGLMILLCPNFKHWPGYKDNYLHKRISYGELEQFQHSSFICHLIEQIQVSPDTLLLTPQGLTGQNAMLTASSDAEQDRITQQRTVIEKIKKVVTGHSKRPLVITADRGRGKTAALGIAAAELANERQCKILVTAPQKASVETLFRHAQHLQNNTTKQLEFIAVDDLVLNEHEADLVIVDEAAALPVELLKQLTRQFARIVFSSTIHGYEGSGRGFEIRFAPWLKQQRPGSHFMQLTLPFRWQPNDPLEQFWWQSLHLKRFSSPSLKSEPDYQDIQIKLYSGAELIAHPPLLNSVFSMLIEAHYQTTPDDFMAMLDAPEQRLFLAFCGEPVDDNLLGALCGNLEGKLSDCELKSGVIRGQRRVQGHMLAQQMALGMGQSQYLAYSYFRVIRIAVNDQYRRCGVGKAMLAHLEHWARSQNLHYLGSSFGASAALMAFWQNSGFYPVLTGFHRDKATAEFNLTVLKPISASGEFSTLKPQQLDNLNQLLRFHAAQLYQKLDNRLLFTLLQACGSESEIPELNTETLAACKLFCDGNRSLELSAPHLTDLLETMVMTRIPYHLNLALLMDLLLKRLPNKTLIIQHQLSGKNQLLNTLKDKVSWAIKLIEAKACSK